MTSLGFVPVPQWKLTRRLEQNGAPRADGGRLQVSRADAAPGVARGSGPALSSVLVGCLVLHRARWPGRRKPSRRSLLPRLALRDLSSQTSRSLVEEETLDESSLGLLLDDEDEALVPWTETEEGLVPYFEKGLSQVSPRNRKPLWPGMEDTFVELAGMPIPNRLADALEERGFVEPSGIQFQAIPKLVRGEHVILDAPTGSGKTLAFLLPILARLQPTVNLGAQAAVVQTLPEHLLPSAAAHDERASFDLQAQRRETGRRRLLNPASRYGLLNAQLSRTSADEAPPSSLREILGRDA
mmetsp:Transcript_44761/g.103538  ORF Transcript_44761/g.103538 Transcript_44761/m.103538 type:complete len:298 (+) Transcript_44761:23-916(+)